MTDTRDKTALLVVGHGTRNETGQKEFWQVVSLVAQELPGLAVAGCFLEMADPDIPAAIQQLAARGATQVVVVPLLLFAAWHVKRDIPCAAGDAAIRHGVSLRYAAALGNHPQLLELSALRFQQSLGASSINPDQIAWILVGRGSRDPLATSEFYNFLAQRRQKTPVGAARGAFLAMARPGIDEVVREVAALPQKWVIVQPHLLFSGELSDRLERMVEEKDGAAVRQRWLLAPRLGCDRHVAAVVADRFRQAIETS